MSNEFVHFIPIENFKKPGILGSLSKFILRVRLKRAQKSVEQFFFKKNPEIGLNFEVDQLHADIIVQLKGPRSDERASTIQQLFNEVINRENAATTPDIRLIQSIGRVLTNRGYTVKFNMSVDEQRVESVTVSANIGQKSSSEDSNIDSEQSHLKNISPWSIMQSRSYRILQSMSKIKIF